MADYWLVLVGGTALVAKHDDFVEWADQVKYEGVEYEAIPLYLASSIKHNSYSINS